MKNTFIPKSFRPNVPGSKIVRLNGANFITPKIMSPAEPATVLLSSKNDLVTRKVWDDLSSQDFAIHLFYDELGYNWDFTFQDGILTFLTTFGKVTPDSIYHRHPGVQENHPHYSKHIALFEVMDIWKGNNIGQKRDHFQNTSKPYQAIHSILQSIKSTPTNEIVIPKTYLVKGASKRIYQKLKGNYIVKSCSSMRSIAATNVDFSLWKKENLSNIPVLFQEKIDGRDYRVHVLDEKTWTLKITSKDHTDYRYSSKESLEYQSENISDSVKAFCIKLSKHENNRLIGVDFIKANNKYYCLESNPGPGWSTFNHPSRIKFNDLFINTLKNTGNHEKNTSFVNTSLQPFK